MVYVVSTTCSNYCRVLASCSLSYRDILSAFYAPRSIPGLKFISKVFTLAENNALFNSLKTEVYSNVAAIVTIGYCRNPGSLKHRVERSTSHRWISNTR